MCSFWEGLWPFDALLQVNIEHSKSNEWVCFAYWKEGGLESPMPPVLSAGGGGRGGGGGEGWVVVSTGGTTATGGSAAGVSEDTNWKKEEKNADLETKSKKTSGKKGNKICGVERNWHKSSTNWERVGRRVGEKTRGMKGEGRRWRVDGEKNKTGKMSITLTHKHRTLFRWMSQGHTEMLSYT